MTQEEQHNSREHLDDRPDASSPAQSAVSISAEEREAISGWRRSVREYIEQRGLDAADAPALRLSGFLDFLVGDDRMPQLKSLMDEQRRELDLFEVLRIQDSEFVHSNFLAWMLDPSRNHDMGSHFLQKFMETTIVAAREQDIPTVCSTRLGAIDWSDVEVRREWQFIDILVLSEESRFVCAIENKIWAAEGIGEDGKSQLTAYREVLEKEFPNFDTHLVFLSPSGMESSSSTEREYWILENYATIRQLIAQCRQDFEGRANQEVLMFLDQYGRTLRRYIVPETSEIGKLATEVYLEHRDAIEFINRHKPDYRTGIKEIIKEAIREQKGWVFCAESSEYVRFRSSDWDGFEELKTGTSWRPDSDSLLLFEFWTPIEPTNTRGPSLTLCQGTDENLRRHLFETALRSKDVFRVRGESLQEGYTYVHEFQPNLVRDADLGTGWADGPVREKLMDWVGCFAKEEFPRISEAVVKCLEEYQASCLEAGK